VSLGRVLRGRFFLFLSMGASTLRVLCEVLAAIEGREEVYEGNNFVIKCETTFSLFSRNGTEDAMLP